MGETNATNFTTIPVKNHVFNKVLLTKPQKHRRVGTAVSVGRNQPTFALATLEPRAKGILPLNLSGT